MAEQGERLVFVDTETTGLEVKEGHRVIEVGCVEMINRRLTGQHFHVYLHPDREIDAGAQEVHGITLEFLADKPRFPAVARQLADFLNDAEVVIHNAAFDVGFLNREFALAGMSPMADYCLKVTDSLKVAREMHPGQKNSLDALCRRYGVDNSNRTLHGALLDAELLADVWLAMTRGQESLLGDVERAAVDTAAQDLTHQGDLVVLRATDEELAAHAAQMEAIDKASKGGCIWKQVETAS